MDGLAWEQQPGEPARWFARFTAYRLLGFNRSLIDALNAEKDAKGRERAQRAPGSWRRAAVAWQWQARAEAWDASLAQQAEQLAEAERIRVLSSGFAQTHERVRLLGDLVEQLRAEVKERLWDEARLNEGLLRQLRGLLDDLAAETGGRIKRAEVLGDGLTRIEVVYADAATGADAAGDAAPAA
jgi:hypothetical protein